MNSSPRRITSHPCILINTVHSRFERKRNYLLIAGYLCFFKSDFEIKRQITSSRQQRTSSISNFISPYCLLNGSVIRSVFCSNDRFEGTLSCQHYLLIKRNDPYNYQDVLHVLYLDLRKAWNKILLLIRYYSFGNLHRFRKYTHYTRIFFKPQCPFTKNKAVSS